MAFKKITEEDSIYKDLENMSIQDITRAINEEDQNVAIAVKKVLPKINKLIEAVVECIKDNGRLFYIGAGTSGRLGILDASECPPTFGVTNDLVIGIIAGGDTAIRKAVEFSEDNQKQGWLDLKTYDINTKDFVIGIAASGTTPYVVNALKSCQEHHIKTGCVTCNPYSPIVEYANFPIEVVVGPEFVTGSSRMKAGTAQKMILNMISTSAMIKIGRIKDNKMVDMQLSNKKLFERGTLMLMNTLNISQKEATDLLLKYKSVRKAQHYYHGQ